MPATGRPVAVVADIAARHGVPLVRRYEAMRYWAGRPQPVSMLSRDAFHMNDQGYECIAGMIAGSLAGRWREAAAPAPAAPQGAQTASAAAAAASVAAAPPAPKALAAPVGPAISALGDGKPAATAVKSAAAPAALAPAVVQ